MQRRYKCIVLAFVFLALSAPVCFAQETEARWKARLEVSYVKTGGNTDNETFSARAAIKREGSSNRVYLDARAIFSSAEGQETSNESALEARYERVLTERFFGFLSAGYIRDKFSGYDYRAFAGPGAGYDLVKGERHSLKGLLAATFHHDEFSGGAGSEDYAGAKAGALYEWKITDILTFSENLDYNVSMEDADIYFVKSETAFAVKTSSALSFGVSYILQYQNTPPSADLERTDTRLLTTLILDI